MLPAASNFHRDVHETQISRQRLRLWALNPREDQRRLPICLR